MRSTIEPTGNINKIKHVSLFCRYICLIIACALPIPHIIYWMYNGYWSHNLASRFSFYSIFDLGYTLRTLILLVKLLPIFTLMVACHALARLFKSYAHGQIFTQNTAYQYRRLGISMLLWAVLDPISQLLFSILSTYQNPPGYHFFNVQIDYGIPFAAFVGVVILVISWVMNEAYQLKEEERYII